MIKLAFAAFGGAGLLTKVITIGVLAAGLLTAYGVWHHKVYRSGFDAAIAKIAAADEKLVKRALQMRGALNDCKAAGRQWDQSTGRCK